MGEKVNNKVKNNKGFTLVELLAVIVVLALIMILAIPTVLNASTGAQKRAFNLEAQKVLQRTETFVSNKLIEGLSATAITDGASGKCYSLNDLEISASGYTGSVKVTYDGTTGEYGYSLYLDNGNYRYTGKSSSDIDNDDLTIASGSTLTAATGDASSCS